MERQQLLGELRKAVTSGEISKDDVLSLLSVKGASEAGNESIIKRLSLSEIFYYIGGIIVLIGLIVLIGQNWENFTYSIRVFTTFGMGLAFFASATFLIKSVYLSRLGTVFYFLSAALIPFGYFVMLADKVSSQNVLFFNVLVPLLCLLQFGLTQYILRNNIFTPFNTVFGTWLFFGLTNYLMNDNYSAFNENFYLYRVIIVGLSYILIGYYLRNRGRLFGGWLNSFGTIFVLGAGFTLNVMAADMYNPSASFIWIVLYPVMLAAAIISSVYLKNSAFLFVGTFCLIGYIVRITAEHFSSTLGWPFALIILGVIIMALGYLAFKLNNKYIRFK